MRSIWLVLLSLFNYKHYFENNPDNFFYEVTFTRISNKNLKFIIIIIYNNFLKFFNQVFILYYFKLKIKFAYLSDNFKLLT